MSGRVVIRSLAAVLVAGLAACGSPSARDRALGPTLATPSVSVTATASTSTATAAPTPSGSAGPASPRATTSATPPQTDAPATTRPPVPRVSPAPTSTWTRSVVRPAPDACAVTAKYRGKDLEVVPTTSRIAVLTFDGGASSTGVSSVLATLSAKRATATFFLTGGFVRRHPASTTAISSSYPVGNHTDTHADLTTLSSTAVVDEIRTGAAAIRAATGRPPGPWFRFPYGARDARTIDLVNDECYVAVRWTVDSLGWKGTSGGMTTTKVRDRVLAAARPGMIVLMHVGANPTDGTTLDAAALPAIVDGLRARGYTFVTLQQAL